MLTARIRQQSNALRAERQAGSRGNRGLYASWIFAWIRHRKVRDLGCGGFYPLPLPLAFPRPVDGSSGDGAFAFAHRFGQGDCMHDVVGFALHECAGDHLGQLLVIWCAADCEPHGGSLALI